MALEEIMVESARNRERGTHQRCPRVGSLWGLQKNNIQIDADYPLRAADLVFPVVIVKCSSTAAWMLGGECRGRG
jgi:hypothetical protein